MTRFGISQPVRRKEDLRLLTGQGRYIDDIAPADALRIAFLRPPVAHARILSIDTAAARAMPGVRLVLTAADLEGRLENAIEYGRVRNRDGSQPPSPVRPILATDRIRYVGEIAAAVVADSRAAALDALEAIEIETEALPAHLALAPGGTALHAEAPDNLAFDWGHGDAAAVEAAFARAARTTRIELVDNRVISNPMEGRGCFAEWAEGRLHLAFSGQGVWGLKDQLAAKLGLQASAVRVTNPDVGGGFGTKAFAYPEYFLTALAAMTLGRPVRWFAERSEGMQSDYAGRDSVTTAEAAFDADHRLMAVRIETIANMGAYCSPNGQAIPSELAKKVFTGVYDVQTAWFGCRGVYTNTTPVDAYRGAGRPEAIYVIERLMDLSARELGIDAAELRRRNFVRPDAFPYRTAAGETFDVGDFARVLDRGLAEADVAGFAARRAQSAQAGRLRGLGLCYYVESILGSPTETARVEFDAHGQALLFTGIQSNGQGHETACAQMLHAETGIPFDRIVYVQGDSDRIATGGGTGGSRSMTTQSAAIRQTARTMIARFMPLAEEALEVGRADIVFEDGAFRVAGTDRAVGFLDLAARARANGLTELLVTEDSFTLPGRSFPNGCHIAEVEIDPETGTTRVVRYTVADDLGTLLNPLLVEGQIHGGVAQGIGQAITERVVYAPDGQLLTASFMDYALPRADDVPMIPFHSEPVPSTQNPLGMKGCGEAGTVGALAAVTNAALDALWPLGVRRIDMPLTPQRVWAALQATRAPVAAE